MMGEPTPADAHEPLSLSEASIAIWAGSPSAELSAAEVHALDDQLRQAVAQRAAAGNQGAGEAGSWLCFLHPSGSSAARGSALPTQPRYLLVWNPPPDLRAEADGDPSKLVALLEAEIATDRFGLGGGRAAVHCAALYTPTGARPAMQTMQPGACAGLMVGLTDCRDRNSLEDFQRWYDEVHAVEALAPGIFSSARRYHRVAGTEQSPEFLALYESLRPGPEALAQLMLPQHKPPSPLHDACLLRGVWAFSQGAAD